METKILLNTECSVKLDSNPYKGIRKKYSSILKEHQSELTEKDITKTYLYNFDPLKPHFHIVKLGFTGVYIIFVISAQKHRLWVLVRTASMRRFSRVPTIYVSSRNMKNIRIFYPKIAIFFVVKFLVYLNRRVFVMIWLSYKTHRISNFLQLLQNRLKITSRTQKIFLQKKKKKKKKKKLQRQRDIDSILVAFVVENLHFNIPNVLCLNAIAFWTNRYQNELPSRISSTNCVTWNKTDLRK